MRICARGPSGTFTASSPARFSRRTPASMAAGATPFGGTISTLVTSSPAASLRPRRERSASASGATAPSSPSVTRSTSSRVRLRPGDMARTASPMRRMCAGVVPQHPPTKRAPAWISRCAYLAMYSGDAM